MPSSAIPSPFRLFPVVAMWALAAGLLATACFLRSRIIDPPVGTPLGRPLLPDASGAFRPDAFPANLPGRDALPALGSGKAGDTAVTGVWTSTPLATSAALLQVRVNGTLRPPGTSLVLRTADGREVAPLETNFSATDRWKRVNFAAPAGSFQIVARDDSPGDWLAFTAPVEITRWSWLLGKLTRPWIVQVALALAIASACAGFWFARSLLATLAASTDSPAWRVVPWAALLVYAGFFARHIDPVAGPNDSGGYLNSAKALASGHLGPLPRPIWGPAAGETDLTPYLSTTFPSYYAAEQPRMAPEYPVGLPLLFAVAGKILGLERAVPVVILLNLVLGVIFTRLFARAAGLGEGWSWLAAALIGLSPVYVFQSLQPQSDGAALVWCTAAVYWAWTSREYPWRAVLAGLATGLAVFIRPSNTLVLLPLLVCLFGHWRQLGLWIAAGLPCAVWQGWYNHTLNGSAFVTGYRDQTDHFFGLNFLGESLPFYVQWLPLLLTPLILLAIAGPFLRAIASRLRLMLAVWAGVFLAFYACYWCTQGDWYNLRFILPAAPALVVLALFAARALAERAGLGLFQSGSAGRSFVPSCLLAVLAATWLIQGIRHHRVTHWMHYNSVNTVGPRWLAEHVRPDAVIFTRDAATSLLYYTELTFFRSDHPKAQSPELLAKIARTGRPIYALNYWWEDRSGADPGQGGLPGPQRGRPYLPGNWNHIVALGDNRVHVWQWSPATTAEK